jgi:pilus assembly protein TadC
LSIALVAVSFVCIATDSLVRVFLLVPCGLYGVLFPSYEALYATFVVGAATSYVEDVIVIVVSFVAGVPLVMIASKLGILEKNNKKGEKAL